MDIKLLIIILSMLTLGLSDVYSADLPVCSNRIIQEVTKRVGCAAGDSRCWLTKGGMCTDYIQIKAGRSGKPVQLSMRVGPEDVMKGDVAQFNARAHFAYIEGVVRDKAGKPIAINVSEYNYGTCWIDRSLLVTDKYKQVSRRYNIPIDNVDGGFWRP